MQTEWQTVQTQIRLLLEEQSDLGAVWSGSALFAQAYLSENLGSLRYVSNGWFATMRGHTKSVFSIWKKKFTPIFLFYQIF